MYQTICDKHEFVTTALTNSGGAPEERFVQCRKCGILQSKKDLTIEEKMDVYFSDKEAGEKLVKQFEGSFETIKDRKKQIQKHFAQKELKSLKVDFK